MGQAHLQVIAAGEEADVVDHGDAGGPELDGSRQQVVPRVALQRAVVLRTNKHSRASAHPDAKRSTDHCVCVETERDSV